MNYDCPILLHSLLKAMMVHIHNTFVNEKIEYFADGGTLLGMIRGQNLIPHDDDIDLGVFEKDFNRVKIVLSKMCEDFNITVRDESKDEIYKVEFFDDPTMLKIYIKGLWLENKINKKIYGTPTIDFFSYKKAGDFIKLSNLGQRRQFKNCFYRKDEMFPLIKKKFDYFEIYSPNKPLPYLHRYYGDDCMSVVKIDSRQISNPMQKDRNNITLSVP